MPKVSIVLPAYNCESTLEATINSVLKQTYTDYELIIINDGSTDETKQICDEFSNLDNRIICFHTLNKGVSEARNKGIEYISGEYLMFIDSDDTYDPTMIESMIKYISKPGVDMVCCGYRKIFKKKRKSEEEFSLEEQFVNDTNYMINVIEKLKDHYLYNQIWNKIYRVDIIKKYNIMMDKELDMGEDYRFNVDYTQNIRSIYILNKVLYSYIVGEEGLTFKYRENEFSRRISNLNYYKKLYDKYDVKSDYLDKQYLKALFASIVYSFSNNTKKSYKDRINMIESFTSNEDINRVVRNSTSKDISTLIMKMTIKLNNKNLILLISYILYLIKKIS
ncbi:glycosyltransferase family 2 protein [uncultured Clostridium sp.]|uniref:glycosyltransferase family 2 protein n=1 Tax=uncultured Clostridium sp. TaxID=59620 RepID=UPI0028E4F8A4|nr:glycosyltransferase family 2 protein [uncultured Clostridium sp.]